jgi:hypothetical protein
VSLGGALPENASPPWERLRFLAGDHHVHSNLSGDGQYEPWQLAAAAAAHGLDWMVLTDHGGVVHAKYGVRLLGPALDLARERSPGLLLYPGLEWNAPGMDHTTVVVPPGADALGVLRDFENRFDGSILTARGVLPRSTADVGEPWALAGLRHLDAMVLAGRVPAALALANHPSRLGLDSPHELRGWRNAVPRVAVGMEGAPGHAAASVPRSAGGRGDVRCYYREGPQRDSHAVYAPTVDLDRYRTRGGFDAMTAIVGGVWDSLLAEGLPWSATAASDCHQVYGDRFRPGFGDFRATGSYGPPIPTTGPQPYADLWPGAYNRTLVGIPAATAPADVPVAVLAGLQAGRAVAVTGGLITGLDVRVFAPDAESAAARGGTGLGGRLAIRRGERVVLRVGVGLAHQPNAGGEIPRPAFVDVIGGPVTGPVSDSEAVEAPATRVLARYDIPGSAGGRPGDGAWVVEHDLGPVEGPCYLRLRGGDGRRLGADGGPVPDTPGPPDPFHDLWFHGGPVFVDVR